MSIVEYTKSEKNRARYQTKQALQTGQLCRKDACEDCGAPTYDCHHLDYSDPLAVAWVCRACHTERHRHLASETPFPEISARLRLLNPKKEAKKWGVTSDLAAATIDGLRLWSPLLPKLARRINVPTSLLRSYFTVLASHRNGNSNSEAA